MAPFGAFFLCLYSRFDLCDVLPEYRVELQLRLDECDRVQHGRVSTLAHLETDLGQRAGRQFLAQIECHVTRIGYIARAVLRQQHFLRQVIVLCDRIDDISDRGLMRLECHNMTHHFFCQRQVYLKTVNILWLIYIFSHLFV